MTGSTETRLVIIRGNSASGKSTVARLLRERVGRGVALIQQDHVRRILLQEYDRPGSSNIRMIDTIARTALDEGYDVIIDGIMNAVRYAEMLNRLIDDHRGRSVAVYLNIPVDETMRRHRTKPDIGEVPEETVRSWYSADDLLPERDEVVFGPELSAAEMVQELFQRTGFRPRDGSAELPPHCR